MFSNPSLEKPSLENVNIEEYINSLPSDIEEIYISRFHINSPPSKIVNILPINILPKNILSRFTNLKELTIQNTKIIELPELPDTLISINCLDNLITELPDNLPPNLIELCCSQNKLTKLPSNLPPNLKHLSCSQNQLTELPSNLPANLIRISCNNNLITELPTNLPATLLFLYCSNNLLTELPITLTQTSIKHIDCRNNRLTNLPILPITLDILYCGQNPIINNIFNITTYEECYDKKKIN